MTLADCAPGDTVRFLHSDAIVTIEVVTPCRVRIRPIGQREPRVFEDAKGIVHTIVPRHPARDVAPSVPVERVAP